MEAYARNIGVTAGYNQDCLPASAAGRGAKTGRSIFLSICGRILLEVNRGRGGKTRSGSAALREIIAAYDATPDCDDAGDLAQIPDVAGVGAEDG